MPRSPWTAALKAGAGLAAAGWLAAAPAAAEDRALYLDVTVNGQNQQLIGGFVERDGTLYATAEELQAVGVRPPEGADATADGLLPLAAIPGLQYDYDEPAQALRIDLPEEGRQPVEIGARDTRIGQADSTYGLLLNYDLIGTRGEDSSYGSGLVEGRVFGPLGVLDTSFLGNIGTGGGQDNGVIRLDTTWTWSDPGALRRYRVGDFISGGLAWTRPVRMIGGQVDRDFTMRPDLITFPVPAFGGDAAVPSTVDVYVNNVKQFTTEVKPGPFEITSLPVLTGGGDARVVVRDALGRETVQTLPFYASRSLLREGFVDYSFEAGSIRRRYGEASADYSGFAGIGSLRYGLDDATTLEAHVETSRDLVLAGAGVVYGVGTLGTVNAAVAGSRSDGDSGLQYAVGVEHLEPRWSVSLQRTGTVGVYQDLAAIDDRSRLRGSTRVSASLNLDRWGSLGVAYIDLDRTDFGRTQIASGNYSVTLFDDIQLVATSFLDLDDSSNAGVMLSLTVPLGRETSVGLDATAQNGQRWLTQRASYVQDTGVSERGLVVNAQASEGDLRRYYGQVDYRTALADFTVAADQIDDRTSVRGEVRGSLTYAGGGVFAGQRIDDSFAVVDTGVPGVGVTLENRPVGRTDGGGQLLVRGLRAYEANKMAIDVTDLPADAAFEDTRRLVTPADRSGIVVRFPVRVGDAATILIHRSDGSAVPPGSMLALDGGGAEPLPVGYDGLGYATGLQPENAGTVTLPDGSQCRIAFAFAPAPGEIPQIGPVTCGGTP
ncbi:MAG: fimbrial biogenesis outer membrane usher protein [Inquilinus limosus]|uniref:Fimbrial biogenesis outer membrane usher protein n=1 Tax=Inquilinus limosus TaxID=171674 RepID=A0A952FJC4_9PROT|nr:fimbrial biogenesis outer membrane usher protein [Inquilinus limosus]